MAKYVSLLFDVEDPFAPDSDDAALTVANVVTGADVRGTFCVTGEKCRKLVERGRTDVIDALKPHALGLHTDTHSFHPSTMEMLEDKGWDDGVAAAIESEGRGLEAFRVAFGRDPVCWGGGGNTWGAQIHGALKQLGIPSLVYSQIALPGAPVHEFLGVPTFPGCCYLGEENMGDDETADRAIAAAIRKVSESEAPWCEVFGGHPTKYRYEQFWDVPYFNGVTPTTYDRGPRVPDDVFDVRMKNLGRAVRQLGQHFTILGLDDVLQLPWQFREASPEELAFAKERTAANIRGSGGWPVHHPGFSAERIVEVAVERLGTLRVGFL